MRKLLSILFLGVAILLPSFVHAATETAEGSVRIEVFEREDCSHCRAEKAFLNNLRKTEKYLIVTYHDIADADHREHFNQLTELEGLPKVTPITIVDGVVIQGFDVAETTGKRITALIEHSKGKPQYTIDEFIEMGGSREVETVKGTCETGEICSTDIGNVDHWVSVPFIGPVNVSKYSLPIIAVVLGFVDGFNPCAMWVLVLFLTVLMEAGSRRRMIEMAGLFIFAEAIMYYLILNVWMTAWDFVGLDNVITPLVGTVAAGAGGFFLYKFYKADTTCNVGSLESKRKTSEKLRYYATAPMTILTALGILGLAFSVNIIEFACSVGIPQTFTKILDLNSLGWAGRQVYNAIYILMYMVDDLIIFGLALYGFEKIGLTTHKYTRASHFIGGLIMIVLGLILLLNPTLLTF